MRRNSAELRQHKTKVIAVAVALVLIAGVVSMPNGSVSGINFQLLRLIILLGIVAALFAFIFTARRKRKRRLKETKDVQLSSLGLTQLENAESEIKRQFGKLPELRHKGSIKIAYTGVLAGRELYVFSHQYAVNTGHASIPVNHTIYAVQTPQWPKANIIPAGWMSLRIGSLFGRRSFKLDLPEFNRRFRVVTADEGFAITLLSPELQRHIITKTTVKWRVGDGWLCLIYSGAMTLDRASNSMRRLERFVELIPPELESWTPNVSVNV